VKTEGDGWASYRYSIDGTVIAGPGDGFGVFLAIGADGVSYVVENLPSLDGSKGRAEIIALSPSLETLARLNIGEYCDYGPATLLDNGQMLIRRVDCDGNLDIVRVATSSPGLAHTAWPTDMHNNARTGWIAPW
jgi:hypothetical protein